MEDPDVEGEIEFLDEDAEIVQHCVQMKTEPSQSGIISSDEGDIEKMIPSTTLPVSSLLVERVPIKRPSTTTKKRKKEEDDSDYDPREDLKHRRKKSSIKLSTPKSVETVKFVRKPSRPVGRPVGRPLKYSAERPMLLQDFPRESTFKVSDRKELDICIPDYDDPLCLPVKFIRRDETDIKRLNNWNNLCLNHLKSCDSSLKPDVGVTTSSRRTVVFRNVKNKTSGRIEATMWNKTQVVNEEGEVKSEVINSVLPRYREKTVLDIKLSEHKKKKHHKSNKVTNEVILVKEDNKEGETLVVYKPKEALSAVYKFIDDVDNNKKESKEESNEEEVVDNNGKKRVMREMTSCKVCAPCYQGSWRGARKSENKKHIYCAVCGRSHVSAYNLLAHLKTHSPSEIKKHKQEISKTLASVVGYHYTCRICQLQFTSLKQIRQHLNTVHTNLSSEPFYCEVGNHTVK